MPRYYVEPRTKEYVKRYWTAEISIQPKRLADVNSRNINEIIILPEKKKKTKPIKAGTITINTRKYLNY